jgi:hypothetical protein
MSNQRCHESRRYHPLKIHQARSDRRRRTLAGKFATINVTGRAGVSNDATAVFLNVVAANPSGPGYLTAFPCGTNGTVCIYTSTDTDLIIDVNGYIPAS